MGAAGKSLWSVIDTAVIKVCIKFILCLQPVQIVFFCDKPGTVGNPTQNPGIDFRAVVSAVTVKIRIADDVVLVKKVVKSDIWAGKEQLRGSPLRLRLPVNCVFDVRGNKKYKR